MKIQIAITDDHPMLRNGLKNLISSHKNMEVIAVYENGQSLLEGLRVFPKPDVLILDVHLPDITGDELTRIITKKYPEIKILAFTSHDSIYFIKTLLKSGAKGYVLKTSEQESLIEAIETVYTGEPYYSQEVKNLLIQNSLKQRNKVSSSIELTAREKDILQYIAEEYTSNEIAEKLHLSNRTVENYRLGLMQKLDVKNMVGLVKKAMELGVI